MMAGGNIIAPANSRA